MLWIVATGMKLMLLNAFRNSPRSSTLTRRVIAIRFTALKSNRTNTGPVTTWFVGAQSPVTTWMQSALFAGAK